MSCVKIVLRCEYVCVHDVLRCTGILFRVYFHVV